MNDAKRSVTVSHFIWRDDANGDQIINLIETDPLRAQFFPDRIESFDASFDAHKRHFGVLHLLLDAAGHHSEKRLIFGSSFFELFGELAIVFGMKVAKCEVLQLAAQLTHSESMRDRR